MQRLITAGCVAASIASVAAGALTPGVARASYPGRAGAVGYEGYFSYSIALFGFSDQFLGQSRPGSRPARSVSCSVADSRPRAGLCPDGRGFSYSPSGNQVVFSGVRMVFVDSPAQCSGYGTTACVVPGPRGLFVAHADGSDVRQVRTGTATAENPAFMPDGSTLVFSGQRTPTSAAQLYTVHGGTVKQLTRSGGTEPAPCANGKVLYVSAGNIFELTPGRPGSRRLTSAGGTSPDCAPNGRSMVFRRHGGLYLQSLSGHSVRLLSGAGPVVSSGAAFSPAGTEVAFLTEETCTTEQCKSQLQGAPPNCAIDDEEVVTVDLRGRIRQRELINQVGCTSNGYDSGETFTDVGWQPVPR